MGHCNIVSGGEVAGVAQLLMDPITVRRPVCRPVGAGRAYPTAGSRQRATSRQTNSDERPQQSTHQRRRRLPVILVTWRRVTRKDPASGGRLPQPSAQG